MTSMETGSPTLQSLSPAAPGQSTVAIFLNDGAGNFHHAGSRLCGIYSISVAVGDFNGDGNLDLAVANRGFDRPGNVKVFLGDGKGGLGKATTYSVAGGPYGIAVGDLNGDGHPDIATALDLGGSVGVFINDGTGHFLKPVTYNAGGGEVVDVKIADLRNDGRNDLVIANVSRGMVVLLNKGNGTFGKPTIYQPTFQQLAAAGSLHRRRLQPRRQTRRSLRRASGRLVLLLRQRRRHLRHRHRHSEHHKKSRRLLIASGNFITGDNAPDLAIPIEEYGKVAIMLNTK